MEKQNDSLAVGEDKTLPLNFSLEEKKRFVEIVSDYDWRLAEQKQFEVLHNLLSGLEDKAELSISDMRTLKELRVFGDMMRIISMARKESFIKN